MSDELSPAKVRLTDGLGPILERESVDDALMIVQSYGPWGTDLNDAHRRQIVLADEVLRLRGLYEMAVRGRAEMRTALRLAREGYASEAATGLPCCRSGASEPSR